MLWLIGIDEAGYGPNLGPFVMTSVACRVPKNLAEADLWEVLHRAVRRHPTDRDGRLLIDDSKLVYSTARGLLELETSVLAVFALTRQQSVTDHLHTLCPAGLAELQGEAWFCGDDDLPLEARPDEYAAAAQRFQDASRAAQIIWGLVRSVIICPASFNQLLTYWGSKGAVLGHALAQLIEHNRGLPEMNAPLRFFIDKHGGRNNYCALLQEAFSDGMVMVQGESMARSTYQVRGLKRRVQLTFEPRADASHFCVALASMVSKYLREVLMRDFNRFWQQHVPGLQPTAGYPGDAARFYAQIRPVLPRLGMDEASVWRRK